MLEDRVALAPNVPGWERLALERLVRDGLELERVAICNDVKAAGNAEARRGTLAGADPALFLSLGTGVAAAAVVGGRVLAGAHGAAGEIAYNLCGVDDCAAYADGRAPREEVAGGRFIGTHARRLTGRELALPTLSPRPSPRRASWWTARWTSSRSTWPTPRSCSTPSGSPSAAG